MAANFFAAIMRCDSLIRGIRSISEYSYRFTIFSLVIWF
jgi:phosphopantetheine adenylyltransferase